MSNINKDDYPERCQLTIKAGERLAVCRCWQSKKFPYCDGSHRQFNEENNCQIGPAIICCQESTAE